MDALMVNWQERISPHTDPQIRREHAARYAWARPVVTASEFWCDLGCGEGVAALDGLGAQRPARTLLVDRDEAAVAAARAALGGTAEGLACDLADRSALDDLARALGGGGGAITCFEVIEHLDDFDPLLTLLIDAATARGFTVLLSVPNDEFTGVDNPHHRTVWGESAFAELRRQLPAGHVTGSQVELAGTVVSQGTGASWDAGAIDTVDQPPTHFLAAFGPRAGLAARVGRVGPVDRRERRAWERQRDSDLEYLRGSGEGIEELRAEVVQMSATIADYKRYIDELEERLAEASGASDSQ